MFVDLDISATTSSKRTTSGRMISFGISRRFAIVAPPIWNQKING